MRKQLAEYRVFWREFRRNFQTTGAVLPSGAKLAQALTRHVGQPDAPPQTVLEAGPGTGAVTAWLIRRLRPDDRLDLVEINPSFAAHLREELAVRPEWRSVAGRVRVLQQPVEEVAGTGAYDAVVSGLPFNNFHGPFVERVIASYKRLLRPGGTLSFFQYIGVRAAKQALARGDERQRLEGISRALQQALGAGEFDREWIWTNVPPAWVHHLRFDGPVSTALASRPAASHTPTQGITP